jgi:hypothetical protein
MPNNEFNELRDLLIEKATKQKKHDSSVINRRAATIAGREMAFAEELENTMKKVFRKGWTKPSGYKKSQKIACDRALTIPVGDTHFQSLIDPEECPKVFGPREESRRLGLVASEVAEFKPHYRDRTKCNVLFLGDIIQGQLHDMREGAPLSVQVCAAMSYLTQFLLYLSNHFPEVNAYCVTGNHGRNKQRHHDRAVQQKWDSLETVIYYGVQQAIRNSGTKNVEVHINKRPYQIVNVLGNKIFVTHGDTVIRTGFPGSQLNVSEAYKQILKWNNSKDAGGPFGLFVMGHVHTASTVRLPNNVVFMTNGCLVPPDAHSLSIGSPDVTCGFQLIESTQKHLVGDTRFITVESADKMPQYEKIIRPFTGFR